MMRHPAARLAQCIDPWAFTRTRGLLSGTLPIRETREIRQWSDNASAIAFTLEGTVDEDNHAHLSGTLEVELILICQRCLDAMNWPLKHRFDYRLIHHATEEDAVEERKETLICADNQLDVAWFLEEEVLLAVPMIAKHENCEPPAHAGDIVSPSHGTPFAALAALKDSMKKE